MFRLILILLTFFHTLVYSNTLNIGDKADFIDLLPYSQVYIDKSKLLTIKDIQNENIAFKENDKKLLAFGYSPDFNVWIKFTLENKTDNSIEKIIEYDNSLTTNIKFFSSIDNYTVSQEGLFYINENRKTLNPIFKIKLEPRESKTFYINSSSYITTLIIKLNLWENDKFYEKEISHQMILALFFGAMLILAIYNLFIYFFTKDISYLFYVLYIVGIANIYLLNQDWSIYIIEFASLLVAFPIFALALFTKSFLQIKQYVYLNKILNIFLILIPLSVCLFTLTDEFNKYRNLLSILLLLYLILITIYSAIRKNKQAYFILLGWFIIFIAILFMFLSSIGVFNIYQYFSYLVEISLVLEAIIFSIALADRINNLQIEKEEVNKKLISQQQNEKQRLKIQVSEKTNDLKIALDEKGLLLKELNHRVKNNMQTIVSLLRLQSDKIEDERLNDIFITIQNRINAMSHLHELLYKQDNITHVNAYEYFDILIEELKDSYGSEVNINFNIKTDLKMEQAIYCGLILNELTTNSLKYAFKNHKGNINIDLIKENNRYELNISDDGIGYNQDIKSNSLGLILVNTLVKEQLRGDIDINSFSGVNIKINWSDNE